MKFATSKKFRLRITSAFFLATLILVQTGCPKDRVVDKLEAYVIVGFHQPPRHPKPKSSHSQMISPGESLPVWFREVFRNDLRKPIAGRSILLDIVDEGGVPVSSADAYLSATLVVTADDGFNALPIFFKGMRPNVYIIRATYDDKRTRSVSYSAPIIVLSGH